ncbi:squalene synthetase-like protein [Coemansia sp. RSA 2706]|nr:squalene synthetase-like protein [Coemansia sp. RSA 2706]KAJ2315476.1 squalene synthetase-like protein [Coemansia sp. RSA 2705]KAJ2322255.1 squalene synthetase-like protein [Coemansia sp. RSA 2704]KAJ2329937.1 squalene synthetase-like protein [Coemansia sp. RSA 2702]KAJ2370478.1 squalene synthetase-like protein [Coemansia sp. RSA 2610]
MDDLFYIDKRGSTGIQVSTTGTAREFHAVSMEIEKPHIKSHQKHTQRIQVIEDTVPGTSRGTAAIKRLNSQFIELDVDGNGKKNGQRRQRRRARRGGKAAADRNNGGDRSNRNRPPPSTDSDVDLEELAKDYMAHLSEEDLEYLVGPKGASGPFFSRDLGGRADSRGDRAPDGSEPVSSDGLEADDPFKYNDRLAEQILYGSDSEELDNDGFPCNLDMEQLEAPESSSRHKPKSQNNQAFKERDRTKNKRGRQRQKAKPAETGPSPGFDPRQVIKRLDSLVLSDELDSIWLQPMNKYERQIVHIFAREYNIKTKSQGSQARRMVILTPTPNSRRPKQSRVIKRVLLSFDDGSLVPEQWTGELQPESKRNGKGKKGAATNTGVRHGRMVAEDAPEVGSSNIGHKMLQQMGWTPGSGLGSQEKGRATPVDVMMRTGRGGLGS